MDTVSKLFAYNLKKIRKTKGWTQESLAELAELSQTAIAHLESGRNWPEKDTISRLAKALEIEETRLFLPASYEYKPTPEEALAILAAEFGYSLEKTKISQKKTLKKNMTESNKSGRSGAEKEI